MPELPEVEIVRRGLHPVLSGQQIVRAQFWSKALRDPFPRGAAKILSGRRVLSTERRGKYILAFLEEGQGFCLHLGMSGRVKINLPGEEPPREKHDHFCLYMKDGTQIVYNDARRFGMFFLISNDTWENQKPFDAMGPEPLGNRFNGEVLYERLQGKRTPIKAALLDQGVVAGVGNIYACEALYEAGISPMKISADLSKVECGKLVSTIRSVLEQAIEAGGSSLRDYRNTKGDLGYFQHHFSVYDREDQACPGCDCNILKTGGVKRIVQAGRSTFYCPQKQT